MLRLLLTLFLVVVATLVYGYFRELNPGTVSVRVSPSTTFDLSPITLMLIAMALGALMVILMVGVRETRHAILSWRSTRQLRRKEKVDALHREAVHAWASKRTGEAVALFQRALALDPNHVESLLWLGNLYRAEQNYAEAIRLHRKARTIDESHLEVLFALARDLEGAKRFEEALQTLHEILRMDPSNLTALIRKRELYMRLEQWAEALELQHRLVKSHLPEPEQRAESAVLVGLTYEVGRQFLERGHPEKARRYFRAAMKLDKTFLPAYIGLGEILIHEGKTKNAAEILEKVYTKTGNLILLHRLEELHLELGEPSEIIRVYQHAAQQRPNDPAVKFYLGKLYYRLEMVDEAFDVLSTLEAPPDQLSDFHKIMANLYLRKHHMEEAVDELKKALGFRKRVVVPYVCRHCHHESSGWSGRCHGCGLWNTYAARPWVDASALRASAGAAPQPTIPYQGLASPFETV